LGAHARNFGLHRRSCGSRGRCCGCCCTCGGGVFTRCGRRTTGFAPEMEFAIALVTVAKFDASMLVMCVPYLALCFHLMHSFIIECVVGTS
jgi:hypothetical protein